LPEPGLNGSASIRKLRLDDLRDSLAASVKMRLRSDVPVGIFLSGGLDSSVVAASACSENTNVSTFTVAFAEQKFNEAASAKRVAAHLGTDHHEITLSQRDVIAALPQALAAMDQPTVDGGNTYFVSRATKQAGVAVRPSGLGGGQALHGPSR